MKKKSVQNKIYLLLTRKNYGLTIEEISNELHINRGTTVKYLAFLEGNKKIIIRDLGIAKLHYPKTKALEVKLK